MRNFSASRWFGFRVRVPVLMLLIFAGCEKGDQSRSFVARVNNETLTPEGLTENLDSASLQNKLQVREFVSRWINSTLLYEEAKAEGFDRTTEVNKTLEEMRHQLAIDQLLEKRLYTDELRQVNAEEIVAYYEEHKGDYLLSEDVARIHYVLFSTRDVANAFRNQAVKTKQWSETLQSFSRDSALAASILGRGDSVYLKESGAPSKELWRTVSQLHAGEVSLAVKTEDGFYVVQSLGLQQKGQVAELPLVEPEVRDRIRVQKHQKALEQFLERLRKKHKVQLNLGVFGISDTSRTTTKNSP